MPLNTLTYTVAHVACLIQNHCVLVATLRVNVYCCRHETFRITQLNSSGGSTLQWGARRRLLCEFLYLDDFIVVFLYTPIAIRNLSSLLVIWIFYVICKFDHVIDRRLALRFAVPRVDVERQKATHHATDIKRQWIFCVGCRMVSCGVALMQTLLRRPTCWSDR